MNSAQWIYKHVFRGIWWLIVGGAITIFVLVFFSSCGGRTNATEDAKQKEAARKVLKGMHEGSDEAIRKYNRSQLQKKPVQPVEESQ